MQVNLNSVHVTHKATLWQPTFAFFLKGVNKYKILPEMHNKFAYVIGGQQQAKLLPRDRFTIQF